MMPLPIDQQIESLVEAHDREMARLHLGCSPYDDIEECQDMWLPVSQYDPECD